MTKGFLIAAPQSGTGKTTITLGLLRAMKQRGMAVGPAKAGPDFIDPVFHSKASACACINLDPWAMRDDFTRQLAQQQAQKGALIVEAMMGLFDGAANGKGSPADLAHLLGLPVVLVVDAARQSHSIAALVAGFKNHRQDINVVGVILNRVGSARHDVMLREALSNSAITVVGSIPRDEKLALPSRHLGLVQAGEHGDLEDFLNHAADVMDEHLDWDFLCALQGAEQKSVNKSSYAAALPPLGQNIAIAQDQAFAFCYPHLLEGWRQQGANLSFFSPLANEAPQEDCDAVFLPGGYPELHGEQLAHNDVFFNGLHKAVQNQSFVYGECGGYMVLGDGLIDAQGGRHKMAGLLPLTTSFEKPKLHLGYRLVQARLDFPFIEAGKQLTAHEFHYSSIDSIGPTPSAFDIEDSRGENLGSCGQHLGFVAGSYLHVIDVYERD